MRLSNFEDNIQPHILERGLNYYEQGRVKNLQEVETNTFVAEVQGVEVYDIFIQLSSNKEIIASDCTCPYSKGPICKHQVASFYQLEKFFESSQADKITNPLEKQLNQLTKEQLVKLVMEASRLSEGFERLLELRFMPTQSNKEVISQYRKTFTEIAKSYKRRGMIYYKSASSFRIEVENLMDEAREIDDGILQFDLSAMFFEMSVKAIQYVDDSGGSVGDLIRYSLRWMEETIEYIDLEEPYEESVKTFNKLMNLAKRKFLDGWSDFSMEIYRMSLIFASSPPLYKKFVTILKKRFIELETEDPFDAGRILAILYDLYLNYGSTEEYEALWQEYIDYSDIRIKVIETFINKAQYKEALDHVQQAEEVEKYPGLLPDWKKYRYQIYKLQDRQGEQFELGKELLLDGSIEYYEDLKALSSQLGLDNFYSDIKAELLAQNSFYMRSIYLKIIVNEQDLPAILAYCKASQHNIQYYAEMLINDYPQEVLRIYEEHILDAAQDARNRYEYKKVCKIIKKFEQLPGNSKTAKIIQNLVDTYPRRPAFIEELSKL